MTLEYHLNEIPWAEVLSQSAGMGYLSHAAGTWWTSRSHFASGIGCTYEQQEAAMPALYFGEILGRTVQPPRSQMNRWAHGTVFALHRLWFMNHAKTPCQAISAVNLTNADG
ncbi:MAG: hypothetical protein ACLS69_01210 [Butyricicoccus sp.]